MPRISFDRFDLGIDHRKAASVADANRLRDMVNAHVITGRATEKRHGRRTVQILESGTKGLYPALGVLNTFYAIGDITHSNPLLMANKVPFFEKGGNGDWVASETVDLVDVWFVDVFNGFIYVVVEYDNGEIRHHYLDDGERREKNPDYVEPEEPEESEEPEEPDPSDPGDPEEPEPEIPEYIDITGVTQIIDPNCPHSKIALKAASKMFSVSVDGASVRFSKTGDPVDWSESEDAGFLPTGLNARGDRAAKALGMYQNKMVVLMRDGAQVWTIDPDPTVMRLDELVENVGSSFSESLSTVSGDLYFLSDFGFRSITTEQLIAKLSDVDIGSPVDDLVRKSIRDHAGTSPKAIYYYGNGKYLCAIDDEVFVYAVSKTAKIAAWSRYQYGMSIEDWAELNSILYLRSGDAVFMLDENAYDDDGEEFEVFVQLPYMDFKSPGDLKHIIGIDLVVDGECYFSIAYDAADENARTEPVRIVGPNTRPHGMIPIECVGTEFSFILTNKTKGPFRLNAITVYYNSLGAM